MSSERVLNMNSAAFLFPAVKGVQAKRDYFAAMVPLEIIPRIFQFEDEELPLEIRAQRVLNKARIPDICNYILNNPDNYVFSSLTVSVDGDMEFQPFNENNPYVGYIAISMSSQFLINDGQHRRAAIAEAIKQNPALKSEHISVVFYRDEGLLRAQQMFSDLNRYAIRPTKSINILFNSREESSIIAKRVIESVPTFNGLVEKEKTTISNRSKALFTLSAVCSATEELLKNVDSSIEDKISLAIQFWTQVSAHITEWSAVKCGAMKSSDVRREYICSLSVTLAALGYGGNALIAAYPRDWIKRLKALDRIDWKKDNPQWEKLVFINGKVAANRSAQRAMSEYIKSVLMGNTGDQI